MSDVRKLSPTDYLFTPAVMVTETSFWAPFHLTEGMGEAQKLVQPSSIADILSKLEASFDGFMIGTEVQVEFVRDVNDVDEVFETQATSRTDGKLYVPEDRFEIVDLSVLEQCNPTLLDIMIQKGVTTALKTQNGFIANDPNVVTLISNS